MKKTKASSTAKCSYCRNRAEWHSKDISKYACDSHRVQLQHEEREFNKRADHVSEADEQSWMRA